MLAEILKKVCGLPGDLLGVAVVVVAIVMMAKYDWPWYTLLVGLFVGIMIAVSSEVCDDALKPPDPYYHIPNK